MPHIDLLCADCDQRLRCVARCRGVQIRARHTVVLSWQAVSACGLEAGELVALSLEGRHPQAARAWVHGVRAGSITLALDRPLRPGLVQQGQVCFVFGTLPTSPQRGGSQERYAEGYGATCVPTACHTYPQPRTEPA